MGVYIYKKVFYIYIYKKVFKEIILCKYGTGFSSVGRAFDCSSFQILAQPKEGCCGYQNVAGSNPASRKNILIKYFLLKY